MKKPILILITALVLVASYCPAKFIAYNLTNRYHNWYTLKFEKFITQIKIQGLFYETSITMKVKLGKTRSRSPSPGNYEFVWTCGLREESVITDCLLWDENEGRYLAAQLLDLSTAEACYDSASQNNPQMLLREYRNRNYSGRWDHFYRLSISPVARDESKEIVITYLTPCQMYWDLRRVEIHSRQFYNPYIWNYKAINNDSPAEFKVLDYDHPDKAPRNVNNITVSWEKQNEFWYAQTGPVYTNFQQNALLRVAMENQSGKFLQTYSDGSKQFYQLATLPHIEYNDRPGRHIVVAIDLREESYASSSREDLIEHLYYPLSLSTTDKDSMAFLISSFNVEWLDNEFKARSIDLIRERLETTKKITPKLNTLPFILREAVKFFNDRNLSGEIWLVSNSSHHGSAATAMDILRQTYYVAENPIKFRIIEAAYSMGYERINNKYYMGNEYLYENLYRLSKGSFLILRKQNVYDRHDAMLDCLAPMVSSVEIDPIPEAGLAYSRIALNRGRKNFNITSRYFEIGMYDGNPPFQLNYFGNYLDKLYYKNFELVTNENPIPEDMQKYVKTYWTADYVFNELLEQPQTYQTIKYIEKLSVENRILTPYSGFVAPGPDGYVGFQKLAAKDSILEEYDTDASEEFLPEEFTLSAYPNPFNPKTTISIELPGNYGKNRLELRIINILGQTIKTYHPKSSEKIHRMKITWDGCDESAQPVGSGIYFVLARSGNSVKSLKMTLLR